MCWIQYAHRSFLLVNLFRFKEQTARGRVCVPAEPWCARVCASVRSRERVFLLEEALPGSTVSSKSWRNSADDRERPRNSKWHVRDRIMFYAYYPRVSRSGIYRLARCGAGRKWRMKIRRITNDERTRAAQDSLPFAAFPFCYLYGRLFVTLSIIYRCTRDILSRANVMHRN